MARKFAGEISGGGSDWIGGFRGTAEEAERDVCREVAGLTPRELDHRTAWVRVYEVDKHGDGATTSAPAIPVAID